jgi:hypothetical protein
MEKVAFIAGTAFCGSSLLNLLLDTQAPAIRGLGERSQTDDEGGGPCLLCNSTVRHCSLYSQWNGTDFYEFNFRHYNCSALVDSSKRTNILLRGMAREPQFAYYMLHMSKTPHAAAYSIMRHWEHDSWDAPPAGAKRDITAAFKVWIETNQLYIDEVRHVRLQDIKPVHYDALACDPAAVIEEICHWLGEPFDLKKLQSWRSPTTHILGGNPGVLMQVLGPESLPENYLAGKYSEKAGKLFTDEAWQNDPVFLAGAIEAYQRLSGKLNRVLASLQYESAGQMAETCRQCLATTPNGPTSTPRRGGLLARIRGSLAPGKSR